jgi:hypothetical protein
MRVGVRVTFARAYACARFRSLPANPRPCANQLSGTECLTGRTDSGDAVLTGETGSPRASENLDNLREPATAERPPRVAADGRENIPEV